MLISLTVCFVVILCAVAFTGLCSFNPDGTIEDGPVNPVDADTIMTMEARAMQFPVRLPATPDGWVANSARRTNVRGDSAPIVGWVTAEKAYLQFLQTSQPVEVTVEDFDEVRRQETDPVTVDAISWRKFTPVDQPGKDTIWARDAGEVSWIVTGTAGAEEFSQLATNINRAAPIDLPARRDEQPSATAAPVAAASRDAGGGNRE